MSTVINDMDSTIAKAMQDIGWPGADQVQEYLPEEEQVSAKNIADDLDAEEETHLKESETEEITAENEDTENEQPEEQETAAETEPKYQPKWKKAALKVLEELPPEQADLLRAEDKRREEAFHKGIEQYREGNNRAKEYDDAVKPFMATIQSLGVQPVQAVQHLLAADHNLRYSQPHQKVGFVLKIMQDYGINPHDVATAVNAAGEQRQIDPEVKQLQDQVYQMQNAQVQAQQYAQAQQQAKIDAEIAEFAADPDHEHFDLLKSEMAALLTAGIAKDLNDAYDQAMKVNPKTSAIWLAQQQQKWFDQRKAKVQSVKKPTNVRSNGRAVASTPTNPATMEETIRAQAEKLGLI